MAKVLFIKPALQTDATWDCIRTCNYLGIWYLASGLKEKGHETRIIDETMNGLDNKTLRRRIISSAGFSEEPLDVSYEGFQAQKLTDFRNMDPAEFVKRYSSYREGKVVHDILRTGNPLEKTLQVIAKEKPDFIGIPVIASCNYEEVKSLAGAIFENFPELRIMMGGQHISAMQGRILEDLPFVSSLFVGDAISTIDDVVSGRNNDRIITGGLVDFTRYPRLDITLVDLKSYPQPPIYTYPSSGPYVDFMFSRSCFRKCDFCVAGSQDGKKVTMIDLDSVDECLQKFKDIGITDIIIQDDAFLFKPESHLRPLLSLLKKYSLNWQNNGGVEFEMLSDNVADMLATYNAEGEGKCTALYIPFNPRAWNEGMNACNTMHSRYGRNFENLKKLRSAGIYVFSSNMIGTPNQDEKVVQDDIRTWRKAIHEGYVDAVLPLSATILPGTRWHARHSSKIIQPNDWAGYSLFVPHAINNVITDPRKMEENFIAFAKSLDPYQKTYPWGSAFYNSEKRDAI